MAHIEFTSKQLADLAGVKRTAASNYLKGRIDKAGRANVNRIRLALGKAAQRYEKRFPQEAIWKALLRGESIGHFEAVSYGTTRLSSVIHRLRKRAYTFIARVSADPYEWQRLGYEARTDPIKTTMHTAGNGATYATYHIPPSVREIIKRMEQPK